MFNCRLNIWFYKTKVRHSFRVNGISPKYMMSNKNMRNAVQLLSFLRIFCIFFYLRRLDGQPISNRTCQKIQNIIFFIFKLFFSKEKTTFCIFWIFVFYTQLPSEGDQYSLNMAGPPTPLKNVNIIRNI